MKIEKFDKRNVTAFHKTAHEALVAVAKEHGIKLGFARGNNLTKDGTKAKICFELTVENPALLASVAKERFQLNALLFGLKPEDFGKKFQSGSGRVLTITDINLAASKRPIVMTDANGDQFTGSAEMVNKGLAAKAAKEVA